MLLNQPGQFGPNVPAPAFGNEALVVQEIKDGRQDIGVEASLFAFGQKDFEEQVGVGHTSKDGGAFKYLQPTYVSCPTMSEKHGGILREA